MANPGTPLDACVFWIGIAACWLRALLSVNTNNRLHSDRVSEPSTARQLESQDYEIIAVITEWSATLASEYLSSVDFRAGSSHNDAFFLKLSDIWSGFNTECFILKLTWCFKVVSVSDFLSRRLSRSVCSVLNCCVMLCYLAKTDALRICCWGLRIIGAATESKRNVAAVRGSTHID